MAKCKDCIHFKACSAVTKWQITGQSDACDEYAFEFPTIEAARESADKKFEFLAKMTRMVAHGHTNGMIVRGNGGVGKTYSVLQILDEMMGKDNYVYYSGYTSNVGMYNNLYMNNDKLIVFDDVDAVWRDLHGINILKAVLDTKSVRMVSWKSPNPEIMCDEFAFTGRIIFITNSAPKDQPHYQAMLTRVLNVNVALSHKELLARIGSVVLNTPYKETTITQRKQVFNKFCEIVTPDYNVNCRLFLQAMDFFTFDKDNWTDLFAYNLQSKN